MWNVSKVQYNLKLLSLSSCSQNQMLSYALWSTESTKLEQLRFLINRKFLSYFLHNCDALYTCNLNSIKTANICLFLSFINWLQSNAYIVWDQFPPYRKLYHSNSRVNKAGIDDLTFIWRAPVKILKGFLKEKKKWRQWYKTQNIVKNMIEKHPVCIVHWY